MLHQVYYPQQHLVHILHLYPFRVEIHLFYQALVQVNLPLDEIYPFTTILTMHDEVKFSPVFPVFMNMTINYKMMADQDVVLPHIQTLVAIQQIHPQLYHDLGRLLFLQGCIMLPI